MNRDEIYRRLQTVFDDVFLDDVKVRPELTAADVAEWDSLAQVSLVVTVEAAFSIRFELDEVSSARNVGDFVAIIERHLGQ